MKLHDNQLRLIRHLIRFNTLDYPSCLKVLDTENTGDRVALSYAFRPLTKNDYISKNKKGVVNQPNEVVKIKSVAEQQEGQNKHKATTEQQKDATKNKPVISQSQDKFKLEQSDMVSDMTPEEKSPDAGKLKKLWQK